MPSISKLAVQEVQPGWAWKPKEALVFNRKLVNSYGIGAFPQPSIHYSSKRGFGTLASGGIRNIKDIAAALSLGADLCGMARPWLVAQSEGRERALAEELIEGLKMICCLTGCKSPHDLRTLDRVNGPNLERWMNADR